MALNAGSDYHSLQRLFPFNEGIWPGFLEDPTQAIPSALQISDFSILQPNHGYEHHHNAYEYQHDGYEYNHNAYEHHHNEYGYHQNGYTYHHNGFKRHDMYQRLEPDQPSLSTNDPLQADQISTESGDKEKHWKVFNNRAQMRHKVGETKGNTPKIALFELPKSKTTMLRVEAL